MDFVNEQNAIGLVLECLENALQTLLKVATVFGAGQQGAHVERVNLCLGQNFRNIFLRDAPGQALCDGGLAHAGFTHQQRVVLAAAAQDLDDALDFILAPDQRVDLAFFGQLVQVLGELLQRRGFFGLLGAFLVFSCALAGLGGLGRVAFLDAVGNEIDHVQAGHALLVEVVHRMRIFFAKDGHQHVGTGHFFLAVAGGLHMHDGALDDALKTQRGLGVHIVVARHLGSVVLDEVGKGLAQVIDVGRTRAQNFGSTGVVEQGQQQVFHGDELVALLPGLDEGHVQADF